MRNNIPPQLKMSVPRRSRASFENGFGLLEIVFATAILSTLLFSLMAAGNIALRATNEALHRTQAAFLFEEGFEALKTIRDQNWNAFAALAPDQQYYLVFADGQWTATATAGTVGIFTRTVQLDPVKRDELDNIVLAGAEDPDTKKAEITVRWQERGEEKKITGMSYFPNTFLE